jgi:hypothetical protein
MLLRGRLRRPVVVIAAMLFAALGAVWPAMAEPATSVAYPAWASATRYTGQAFDTCTAPPLPTMQAWLSSPYRAVGIYVGGENRTCAQPELTASWVRAVANLGWRLIPIFKGLQAPCGGKPTDSKILPAKAAAQGTSAADNAAGQVKALGMFRGSAIYYDMEHYTTTDAACRTAVLTFLSAWTKELHHRGYVSSVYENLNLGARDLAEVYNSAKYARPDALWIARYDLNPLPRRSSRSCSRPGPSSRRAARAVASARSFMPSSILRLINSMTGSMTDPATRAGPCCLAARLRDGSRHFPALAGSTWKDQMASHAWAGGCSRSTIARPGSIRATGSEKPAFRPSQPGRTRQIWSPTARCCHSGRISRAVDPQPQQILQPVVAVHPAAVLADLDQASPGALSGGVNRDGPRDHVRRLRHPLITWQRHLLLGAGGAPGLQVTARPPSRCPEATALPLCATPDRRVPPGPHRVLCRITEPVIGVEVTWQVAIVEIHPGRTPGGRDRPESRPTTGLRPDPTTPAAEAASTWLRPHVQAGRIVALPDPPTEMLVIGPVGDTSRRWLAGIPGIDLSEASPPAARAHLAIPERPLTRTDAQEADM